MAFVVDGSEWNFNGWQISEVREKIDAFLDFIGICRDGDQIVWIGDDFQTRSMFDGHDLWTIASVGGVLGLDVEMVQELAAWLMQAPSYLDEDNWPNNLDDAAVSIDGGEKQENLDVAWVHYWTRLRRPLACIGMRRSGRFPTITAIGAAHVHWVRDGAGRPSFWREAIVIAGDSEDSLRRFASGAYPSLLFHDGALDGLRDLGGGYLALRNEIKRALQILDEGGASAFTDPPVTNQNIQHRFRNLGLNVAPENPNVYLNGNCRIAREISIDGTNLYCEWHVKIEPHRNRIHIHPPTLSSQDRLIVAIIHDHLPLPG
ncbi:hypothetical protein [Rhizobium ruizarguesonis]|uniref:hypothetical protein n=1 Tax=Rhizobium ruizarguesonis TaxID=2081791 RepID=UPI00102F3297|nr:hypothetical protein [Rhizobium ruizarguesonis]TBD84815.1 hypothetical protein ELH13_08195 [Rhizobium ruizarguesonis]